MTEEAQAKLFDEPEEVEEEEQSIEEIKAEATAKAKQARAKQEEEVEKTAPEKPAIPLPDGYDSVEQYLEETRQHREEAAQLRRLREQAEQARHEEETKQFEQAKTKEEQDWLDYVTYLAETKGPREAYMANQQKLKNDLKQELLQEQYAERQYVARQGEIYDGIVSDKKFEALHPYMPKIADYCIKRNIPLEQYLELSTPILQSMLSSGGGQPGTKTNGSNITDEQRKRIMDLEAPDTAPQERAPTEDEEFEAMLPGLFDSMGLLDDL